MSVNPDYERMRRQTAGSRGDDPLPYPQDRVLEEVSRKATELERRTRALEAENTKLRREHTKALLAAAQAQEALKEFHASAPDEPCAGDDAPPPATPTAEPAPNAAAASREERTRPPETGHRTKMPPTHTPPHTMRRPRERSQASRERTAFGSLTIAACLVAMTVNYVILLRHVLHAWFAGLAWPIF